MKMSKATPIYGLICDTPVCISLCVVSSIINISSIQNGQLVIDWANFNWISTGYNFVIALILAMCVSCFVPLVAIGKWFTGLFGVEHETFKGNLPYRLLAMFISSLIFFIVITPSLNVINCYIIPLLTGNEMTSFKNGMISLGINTPFMILVGYVVSVLADIPAYQVAHKIDPKF